MKIALVAVGSRGDVEPYLALGVRLQRRGHTVHLAALADFEPEVRAAGLPFRSLGALPARFKPRAGDDPRGDSSTRFRGVLGRVLFWSFFPGMLAPELRRFVDACEGVDAVLHTRLAVPVPHVAERLGVPCFAAFPVPHAPTAAFENPLYVRAAPASPWRTRASYALEWGLTHQLSYRVLMRFRRHELGLPSVPRRALRAHLARLGRGTLYGYSEAVVPRPGDWEDRIAVTGYWFRDVDPAYVPPSEVESFLADGEPPVCVSFGSMKARNPGLLGAQIMDALAQTGRRAIWQSGWGGTRLCDTAGRVLVTGDLPHGWLFPRVAAVVHHGGAGTTAAALRAGVPSVIVPHAFDQPFWGRRIAALGAGPPPIDLRDLTGDRLASALRRALDDPTIRAAAAQLGETVRGEHGTDRAVDQLERWLAAPP